MLHMMKTPSIVRIDMFYNFIIVLIDIAAVPWRKERYSTKLGERSILMLNGLE